MLYSFIFQILNSSQRLMGGETLPCPNSMCKERFTSGFEEMKRFMDHTINCQPFYFCANCNQQCPSRPSLIRHQKACIATALKLMQVKVTFWETSECDFWNCVIHFIILWFLELHQSQSTFTCSKSASKTSFWYLCY